MKPGTAVIERLVEALGVSRPAKEAAGPEAAEESEVDAERTVVTEVPVPPAEARAGLEETFPASVIPVHLNEPSPERAAELRDLHLDAAADRALGTGTPPLVERKPPIVPSRPLSYTAISAFEECGYRFYMERVLGLPAAAPTPTRNTPSIGQLGGGITGGLAGAGDEGPSAREERSARGAAVHALLEWSQANSWAEPSAELARRHALAAGLDLDHRVRSSLMPHTATSSERSSPDTAAEELLGPVRDWIGSALRVEIAAATRVRAEVPILLRAKGTVLRGSIDLLVEREGAPPLVVDYKTDRLRGEDPAARAAHYEIQRSIYALAAAESLGADEVEVAYVFLERADTPARTVLTRADMDAGQARIDAAVEAISAGEFSPAPEPERTWDLCRGCPALGRLCSGPPDAA
jgi:hypothetical protein